MSKVFQDFTTQLGKIEDRNVQAAFLVKAASVIHDSIADRQLEEYTRQLKEHEKVEIAARPKALPAPQVKK